jgi:Tol biopolymer transport system component
MTEHTLHDGRGEVRMGAYRRAFLAVALSLGMLSAFCVPATLAHATPPGENGGLIAFSTDQTDNSQIFTVHVDGTGLKQLTHVPEGHAAFAPDFSPDGKWIVFNSDVTGEQELWVMRWDGSDRHRLMRDPRFIDQVARWSPDGSTIAFQRCAAPFGFIDYCDLDLIAANGSGRTKIVGGRWMNQDPEFSPDGQQIVFDSTRGGFTSTVWRANVDGTGLKRITPPSLMAFVPDWAPDGRHILFSDNAERPNSNIYEMRPDGTDMTQITHVPSGDNAFASYSPNGRRIVFFDSQAYVDEPFADLYVMNRDGSDRTLVAAKLGVLFSDWAPERG